VSVETWTAIIAAFVALVALYIIGQSAAVRPADAAEKQTDIQE
jgi:Na+/H+ antiporter NhaC